MTRLVVLVLHRVLPLALILVGLLGCGRARYVGPRDMYTQVNLRMDRNVIWSVNYQGQTLLPVCTPVHIDAVGGREIRFTVKTSQQRIRYIMHRSAKLPVEQHLGRLFAPDCPDLKALSEIDRQGIQRGTYFPGMSKAGVLIALGYPPEHRTPNLTDDTWHYWETRMGQFEVKFQNDAVVSAPGQMPGGVAPPPATPASPAPPPQAAPQQARVAYTLVNLRADRQGRIESINYRSLALVPVCTEVRLGGNQGRQFAFTSTESGASFQYQLHEATQLPVQVHQERVLGALCPKVHAMSPVDQQGIRSGQAVAGMSKDAVIIALGYPPDHATPSTEADVWRYWNSRMDSFDVVFDDGAVAEVRD